LPRTRSSTGRWKPTPSTGRPSGRPLCGASSFERHRERFGLVRDTLTASGHKIQSDLNLIDGLAVDLSTGRLASARAEPAGRIASRAMRKVRASQVNHDQPCPQPGGVACCARHSASPINPRRVAAVGIAVIDSGISASPEFDTRISAFYDFTKGGVATLPFDDYGHGTHVAGLIGGNGAQASQYRGSRLSVHLIGLKVLDGFGAGKTSDVIAAIRVRDRHRSELDIDVINLSLGHFILESASTDPLVQAVERAVHAGIVVVTAAGNFGTNPQTGLVGYAGIMSPGQRAVGHHGRRGGSWRHGDPKRRSRAGVQLERPSWYDGYAKPDLGRSRSSAAVGCHRGQHAVSAARDELPRQFDLHERKHHQRRQLRPCVVPMVLSGTSMATAVTSGVVATLLDASRTCGFANKR